MPDGHPRDLLVLPEDHVLRRDIDFLVDPDYGNVMDPVQHLAGKRVCDVASVCYTRRCDYPAPPVPTEKITFHEVVCWDAKESCLSDSSDSVKRIEWVECVELIEPLWNYVVATGRTEEREIPIVD